MVTNGVYANGGKVMETDLMNRVAIYKPLLVQSMNGPLTTIIQGAPGKTNTGPDAVRCVWMTNGAVLSGFTLRYGATRTATTNVTSQHSGAGIWGVSTNAAVTNCLIYGNAASYSGGGAYQVSLINCTVSDSRVTAMSIGPGGGGGAEFCNLRGCLVKGNFAQFQGGGVGGCTVRNSAIWRNSANQYGGGAYGSVLVNCTVSENLVPTPGQGAGVFNSTLTNCIVYANTLILSGDSTSNYNATCTLRFCCTVPLPTGTGNISIDPLFVGDGVHISSLSPCRGVGTASALLGTDIDGQTWSNPPSIGCDEWLPVPLMPYPPQISLRSTPVALNLGINVLAGQQPFTLWWQKDDSVLSNGSHYTGADTTNLTIAAFGPGDVGSYSCVASNLSGMATSPPVQVVVHCVAANTSPLAPYSDWATAATNIQDAIDASASGDFVLVTNGIYASGGRPIAGDLTNRIVIDKPLFVASVNGSGATVIQGANVMNGPSAVRCAWLADGTVLNGFTVQGGATRTNGDAGTLQTGGGIWAGSTNATVANCVIQSNSAAYDAGGCFGGFVRNCSLLGNRAGNYGGAAESAFIQNSFMTGNFAFLNGGAVSSCSLVNCTVTFNRAGTLSGAVYRGSAVNSILYYNSASTPSWTWPNWDLNNPPAASYCCTTPALSGTANLTSAPLFLNTFHLPLGSPCIGAGSAAASYGTDMDGQPWANPPSIGCDEFILTNFVGPVTASLQPMWPNVVQGGFLFISPQLTGKYYTIVWSWGDGTYSTNSGGGGIQHRWNSPGTYTVALTAYNQDYPGGVSASFQLEALPQATPFLSLVSYTGTNASVVFAGQPGGSYNLERAPSLTSPIGWQLVTVLNATNTNSFSVVDTAPWRRVLSGA
jgi:hypothetical protein